MGTLLKWVGGIWAVLGAGNVVSMMARLGPGSEQIAQGVFTFGLIFNFVLFILPGLAVYGIGARLTKAREPDGSLKPCPYCAETIKIDARVCRYCQRDLTPIDLQKPV